MTTNDNDYILARWRDAITDPPPGGWCGLNTMANGARYYGACGYMPGDQWLDVTTIPAVPREAVQAAVDGIRDCSSVLRREGYEPVGHDNALMHIANHTGVTPSEVAP